MVYWLLHLDLTLDRGTDRTTCSIWIVRISRGTNDSHYNMRISTARPLAVVILERTCSLSSRLLSATMISLVTTYVVTTSVVATSLFPSPERENGSPLQREQCLNAVPDSCFRRSSPCCWWVERESCSRGLPMRPRRVSPGFQLSSSPDAASVCLFCLSCLCLCRCCFRPNRPDWPELPVPPGGLAERVVLADLAATGIFLRISLNSKRNSWCPPDALNCAT